MTLFAEEHMLTQQYSFHGIKCVTKHIQNQLVRNIKEIAGTNLCLQEYVMVAGQWFKVNVKNKV